MTTKNAIFRGDTGASYTLDLYSLDGSTLIQEGIDCDESLTVPGDFSAAITAVVASDLTPYMAKILSGVDVVGSTYFDLKETAGSYIEQDFPTAAFINAGNTGGGSGGEVTGFSDEAIAAIQNALANRQITVASPLVTSADGVPLITLVSGDDYYHEDGREVPLPTFTGSYPDWTGATATVEFGSLTVDAVIVTETGSSRSIYFELSAEQTAALAATTDELNQYSIYFDVVVTLANEHRTTVVNRAILTLSPST